jgi:hypothetical protein
VIDALLAGGLRPDQTPDRGRLAASAPLVRSVVTAASLLSVVAGLALYGLRTAAPQAIRSARAAIASRDTKKESANRLLLGWRTPNRETISIALKDPEDYDGLTRRQILDRRATHVLRNETLLKGGYTPTAAVFDDLRDGRPWWGLDGVYFFGAGPQSAAGPSEASRWLANPYLLMGVSETAAYVSNASSTAASGAPYPKPESLEWNARERAGRVVYDVSSHFRFLREYGYPNAEANALTLIAYNARDLGFTFAYIDPDGSMNIAVPANGRPARIRQHFHTGVNCGVEGGCTSMTPYQREWRLRVPALPARATVKLWRTDPGSPRTRADFTFIIDLK